MPTRDEFRFQPGWATPQVVDYSKPGIIAWLLRRPHDDAGCLAERQGRCPGRNQCHDCSWSPQASDS
jgi:hypothetical protein